MNSTDERLLQDKPLQAGEELVETSLRPRKLGEFVGQQNIKDNLSIAIEAAKKRQESMEHILLYGNPGLGKTTLAHIIANEMGSDIKVTSGPALEKIGDLAAILSNLREGEIFFIDEIHRLNKTIEEVLYPALEDYSLDIVIGKGPAARVIRMPLSKFTLIGATTRISMIAKPLRDRFGLNFHLNYYTEEDIEKILVRNMGILEINADKDAIRDISKRCRSTPRIANRLLKRVRDFACVKGQNKVTGEITRATFDLLSIDHLGLDDIDRRLLISLIKNFSGGPTGLSNLAASISEETDTLESIYEPFLIQKGFLERTQRGRKATILAYKHLGFNITN